MNNEKIVITGHSKGIGKNYQSISYVKVTLCMEFLDLKVILKI